MWNIPLGNDMKMKWQYIVKKIACINIGLDLLQLLFWTYHRGPFFWDTVYVGLHQLHVIFQVTVSGQKTKYNITNHLSTITDPLTNCFALHKYHMVDHIVKSEYSLNCSRTSQWVAHYAHVNPVNSKIQTQPWIHGQKVQVVTSHKTEQIKSNQIKSNQINQSISQSIILAYNQHNMTQLGVKQNRYST